MSALLAKNLSVPPLLAKCSPPKLTYCTLLFQLCEYKLLVYSISFLHV